VNTGFAHLIFLFEDDGIVSTSASNSKEGTASKLSPLEMSPFKRRRSSVAVRLSPFDLTPADGGRNVDAFVRGDQSPPSTFGFRPAWSTLRARRSESISGKHPSTGTWMKVAAGTKQPETARGNSGQPAQAMSADHCGATSESTTRQRATDGPVTPN
jgi:hypothetical protein